MRGCNVKSGAKEHNKVRTGPSLGSYFDIRLTFYFRERSSASPDLQSFHNLLQVREATFA